MNLLSVKIVIYMFLVVNTFSVEIYISTHFVPWCNWLAHNILDVIVGNRTPLGQQIV